jgi:hypothetical protein
MVAQASGDSVCYAVIQRSVITSPLPGPLALDCGCVRCCCSAALLLCPAARETLRLVGLWLPAPLFGSTTPARFY